jgi:flagellar basal-body rod protein FlgF
MDRMIYIAMTGAKEVFNHQATVSHNLSNATTNGFRAQLAAMRATPVFGEGSPTRTFVVDSTPGSDFTPGSVQHTGRDLDVAVQGQGWIAVQAADGKEAYTRNGSLQVSANGILQTRGDLNVVGDGGPISIPFDTEITVAGDGTISTVPTGTDQLNAVATVGRIKLVNPPEADLVRGDDGLFRLKTGTAAPADENVSLMGSSLEGSNVNVVDSMVNMISLARQFDMQIKLIQNADSNAKQASQILNLTA